MTTEWEVEEILDGDLLYMRFSKTFFVKNEVQPGAFRAHGVGMSTDWSNYSTPQQTRLRAVSKPPSHYGVLWLRTGSVRALELKVTHTPEPANRAHADVTGAISDPDIDKTEIRELLSSIAHPVIRPSDPVDETPLGVS